MNEFKVAQVSSGSRRHTVKVQTLQVATVTMPLKESGGSQGKGSNKVNIGDYTKIV